MKRVKFAEDAIFILRTLEDSDTFFYVSDGQVVRSLKELSDVLGAMSDETFRHHVKKNRNDFSKWVLKVLRDRKLARELSPIRNRRLAKALVDYRVVWLEVKAYEGG